MPPIWPSTGLSAALKVFMDCCMGELRQVAKDLRPAALSHLGVGAALKEHADYFSRLSGLSIDLHVAPDLPDIGDSERLLLFLGHVGSLKAR
jgi:signal transduction histidine kinase